MYSSYGFDERKPARTAAPSPWALHPPVFRAGRSIEVSLCPVCVVAGLGANPIVTAGFLAHLPEQGLGVPLCGLGIQEMYAGFRIFSFQGSRELFTYPLDIFRNLLKCFLIITNRRKSPFTHKDKSYRFSKIFFKTFESL